MAESVTKFCMMCHKKVYTFVEKCGCGSHDFFKDETPQVDMYEKSKIYVLLPNGEKQYIAKQIIHVFKPKVGGFTVAGYPILEDIEQPHELENCGKGV